LQYPKDAAAVGPFSEGRQNAHVIPRRLGAAHSILRLSHSSAVKTKRNWAWTAKEVFGWVVVVMMMGGRGGSMTAPPTPRFCRAIEPSALQSRRSKNLDFSYGCMHKSLNRKDEGVESVDDLGPFSLSLKARLIRLLKEM
jgi:hypothetical protein